MRRTQFARSQRRTIMLGILCLTLIIVILQLWLLTATMEAYLSGERSIVLPAAAASFACFVLVLGLLRSFRTLE
jgi:hypothetical protein